MGAASKHACINSRGPELRSSGYLALVRAQQSYFRGGEVRLSYLLNSWLFNVAFVNHSQ